MLQRSIRIRRIHPDYDVRLVLQGSGGGRRCLMNSRVVTRCRRLDVDRCAQVTLLLMLLLLVDVEVVLLRLLLLWWWLMVILLLLLLMVQVLMVRQIDVTHYGRLDRNLVVVVVDVVMAVRGGRDGHRYRLLFDYRPTGRQLQGLRHLLPDRVQHGLWQ